MVSQMFTARSQFWSITAQYLDRYQAHCDDVAEPSSLLPVTGAQRRFLLARRLSVHERPDLLPLFFAFPRGAVDLRRLGAAAGYVAARHPVLRTRSRVLGGVPVLQAGAPTVHVERVCGPTGGADALRDALGAWPEGPPLRIFLATPDNARPGTPGAAATASDRQELLALVMDHAAGDEHSIGRVIADLSEAYAHGLGPHDLPQSRAREALDAYRDAVHLQLAMEHRASGARSLSYWTDRLAGISLPRRPVGTAAERTGTTTGSLQAHLPTAEEKTHGTGRALAFPALLTAGDRAARIIDGRGPSGAAPLLGYPWGGRPHQAADTVGCFLNTVPYTAPEGGMHTATEAWCDDLEHADTPFDEIVRAARAAGLPWTGAFDALLTFEDLDRRPPLRLGAAEGTEVHIDGRPLQAPLTISLSQGTDPVVRMAWELDTFPGTAAEASFSALLAALPTS